MQKLELRNNLNGLVQRLKTKELIAFLETPQIEKSNLLTLVIDSKSGYDQALTESTTKKVFEQFDTEKVYNTKFFSSLVSFISNSPHDKKNRTLFLANQHLNDFYSFHKTLISTYNLIDNLLLTSRDIFDVDDKFDIESAQKNGNLILQVIDDENVGLLKFSEIISSLEKLIDTIYFLFDKVENEKFDIHPVVTMIDSGSDINIVVKLPEKAVNLIAQIIKQMWDLIANNSTYRHGQKLENLDKTITVLGKLKEAQDKNVIDRETAEVLKKGIIENAEKIILKNTLTKQIVIENKEFSNRQLILEQSKRYQLGAGKRETEVKSGETEEK